MTVSNMATPRGKRIHRLMHDVAKEVLAGTGLRARIDFSKRGGHQSMVILRDDEEVGRVGMVSTPRSEGTAIRYFRERMVSTLAAIQSKEAA